VERSRTNGRPGGRRHRPVIHRPPDHRRPCHALTPRSPTPAPRPPVPMFRRFHLASRPFSSAHSWDAGPGPKGDCSRGRDRVGGYDRAGEFLALGILQDFDPEQERLRILTPLPDPARIAAVAFGSLRLEPTGKDSVSPPGARPFARVRKDTKVATSPSRRGRRRGRDAEGDVAQL
jgi:hypothetical protein